MSANNTSLIDTRAWQSWHLSQLATISAIGSPWASHPATYPRGNSTFLLLNIITFGWNGCLDPPSLPFADQSSSKSR